MIPKGQCIHQLMSLALLKLSKSQSMLQKLPRLLKSFDSLLCVGGSNTIQMEQLEETRVMQLVVEFFVTVEVQFLAALQIILVLHLPWKLNFVLP